MEFAFLYYNKTEPQIFYCWEQTTDGAVWFPYENGVVKNLNLSENRKKNFTQGFQSSSTKLHQHSYLNSFLVHSSVPDIITVITFLSEVLCSYSSICWLCQSATTEHAKCHHMN